MPKVFELVHVCTRAHVSARFASMQDLSARSCSGSSYATCTTAVYSHAPCGHTFTFNYWIMFNFFRSKFSFFSLQMCSMVSFSSFFPTFYPVFLDLFGDQGSPSVKKPSGKWRKPKIGRIRPSTASAAKDTQSAICMGSIWCVLISCWFHIDSYWFTGDSDCCYCCYCCTMSLCGAMWCSDSLNTV